MPASLAHWRSLSSRFAPLLAAAAYAVVALWWSWPLATQVSTHALLRGDVPSYRQLMIHDQMFTVAGAARNAASILRGEPGRLLDQGLCHPMEHATALSEHMIELGVLALPGYALTRDPVVAYNTALLFAVLVAGSSCFALVRRWTGSAAAAFAAGLFFAFHPSRINDLVHPYVVGNHWMPLVLLLFERLLEGGRVRDAVGLALAASLQAATGAYPLLVLALFAGPVGAWRLATHRRHLDARRIALLAAAVACTGAVAAAILTPYARVGETWGIFRSRGLILAEFAWLAPGGQVAVGGLALLLALPLVFLRPRAPSPAPGIAIATVLCIALSTRGPLWPGGPAYRGVYAWLADHFWMLDVVRGPGAIRVGAYLGAALLAGLGFGRLLGRLPRRAALALSFVVPACLLLELFHPALAPRVYGAPQRAEHVRVAPEPEEIAPYHALDDAGLEGPVLDLPHRPDEAPSFYEFPRYVLLSAYHRRRIAACYGSYLPPSAHDVARMAEALPAPGAVDELAASGLRNLVFHRRGTPRKRRRQEQLLEQITAQPGVDVVASNDVATAVHIARPVATLADPGRLRVVDRHTWVFEGPRRLRRIWELEIENEGERTWVLRAPVAPVPARVVWRNGAGDAVAPAADRRALLPLALAPGDRARVRVDLGDPPAACACAGCACAPELEIPSLGWSVAWPLTEAVDDAPRGPAKLPGF